MRGNFSLYRFKKVIYLAVQCGQPEDFKHGVYNCSTAVNLYKYVFDNIKIGATVKITNMILSHERLPGATEENILRYDFNNCT